MLVLICYCFICCLLLGVYLTFMGAVSCVQITVLCKRSQREKKMLDKTRTNSSLGHSTPLNVTASRKMCNVPFVNKSGCDVICKYCGCKRGPSDASPGQSCVNAHAVIKRTLLRPACSPSEQRKLVSHHFRH